MKNRINSLYRLLLSAYSVSMFSEGVLLPIYAVFVQKIGGDILDASGAMAVFLISQGIFTIIIQRMKRTYKHHITMMIVGWIIWLMGIALYLAVSSTRMLFITQILVAMGNAIADPIFDKELADHTDKNNKLFERGLREGLQDIISGLAAIIGGLIAVFLGFKMLIGFMILTGTISLIIILLYVKKYRAKQAI
ncbi:MAG: MFS transporter [candidate division SR1 bacterium]|nr:MFS transporter [candidate division SR1 bacterium]